MKSNSQHKREETAMTFAPKTVSKTSHTLFYLTALAVLVIATALAQTTSTTDAQRAFTTIKSLPGTWEGKTAEGPVQVTFKVISDGSAVMSEIHGHGDMVTMFHLDGPNRLLMTHYCSSGNQPRMQASVSPDGKTLTFKFVDATNLATPDAAHMQSMILTILDDGHHTEEWTFADHGKEMKEVFDLRRKI
jgi:hypothetical protein